MRRRLGDAEGVFPGGGSGEPWPGLAAEAAHSGALAYIFNLKEIAPAVLSFPLLKGTRDRSLESLKNRRVRLRFCDFSGTKVYHSIF